MHRAEDFDEGRQNIRRKARCLSALPPKYSTEEAWYGVAMTTTQRALMLTLAALSLTGALVVHMGWLGTADIGNRGFDRGALLISGFLLLYLSFRRRGLSNS